MREHDAVAFERLLFQASVDMGRFRANRQIQGAAPVPDAVRSTVDREVAEASAYVRERGDVQTENAWRPIAREWSLARTVRRIYAGRALDKLIVDVSNLIYNYEDSSGLTYEPNKFAQDLADALFAKVSRAPNDAQTMDMLTENAIRAQALTIPQRIRLAGTVGAFRRFGNDVDLNADDWDIILGRIERLHMGTAAQAARYARDGRAYVNAAGVLERYVNANIVMTQTPNGDAAVTHRLAHGVTLTALRLHGDLAQMLDSQILARAAEATRRNNYLYVAALLSAVLLVGIMLIVAEITARRDRDLLNKAKQESERLSAELARQKAERALRLSEAQFRAVFDGAALGIGVLDRNGSLLDSNAVFRGVYGENALALLESHESEFAELMRGERELFEFEHHVMTPAGQEAWTDCTVSLVNDEAGNPFFAMCTFRDLTELKRNERRMLHDMTHDSLTGLPNRSLFETNVREQFAEVRARPQGSFAVLFVDLDRFKDINESLGHEAGDFVLAQVGHRLRTAIEAADVVARLGSDEFAVLVRSLPDVLHVEVIARRVLNALAKPVALGSRSIFISGSVGIALASTGYQRGEDIMRDADIAMRYAKSGGGGRFALFDSKMHARAEKRLQLTTDLRLALEHGEFDLLYQPIVHIADGELVGCEALLRWNHPIEGVMLPNEFMPLAEQTALAIPIGRFVLRTACRQIARWKRVIPPENMFPVNVNVSAGELLDPEFENTLNAAVREFGIAPCDLMLEITESVVLDAGTRPNALVERLRSNGFNICIDDFGTGYSSLRYLQQFKVDAIKIDRSFVSGPDGDIASEPIVRTLMTLAEAFDVKVVAEGIETPRQRDALRNAGCRFGQGFYYSRAVGADELAALFPVMFIHAPSATA